MFTKRQNKSSAKSDWIQRMSSELEGRYEKSMVKLRKFCHHYFNLIFRVIHGNFLKVQFIFALLKLFRLWHDFERKRRIFVILVWPANLLFSLSQWLINQHNRICTRFFRSVSVSVYLSTILSFFRLFISFLFAISENNDEIVYIEDITL